MLQLENWKTLAQTRANGHQHTMRDGYWVVRKHFLFWSGHLAKHDGDDLSLCF
jgi:hypothetical protein